MLQTNSTASTRFGVGGESPESPGQCHPRQWVGLSADQPHPLTQVVLTSPVFPTPTWRNTKSGSRRIPLLLPDLVLEAKSENPIRQYHPRQRVGLSADQPHPLTQVVLTRPVFPTPTWRNTKSNRSSNSVE